MMTDEVSSPTSAISRIAAITQELAQIEEQSLEDEQRMRFLVNADTARQDFYEIRSQKNDEVRRIIIDNEAAIIFDSENKVKIESGIQLPEFDEIDTKFLKVIPDTSAGRDYYRRLRGLQNFPNIPKDLPRKQREEMRREQSQTAKEEAKQLRQIIVENFREQDDMERQSEVNEIFMRVELRAQQEADLRVQQERHQLALVELHKEKRREELKRKQEQEAIVENHEAKRKEEFSRRRNAWLDRLSNPTHNATGNQKTADDAAVDGEFNFSDQDKSQQSQAKEEGCIVSDAATCLNCAEKSNGNATDREGDKDGFESDDEDEFESCVDPLGGSCSLKDECIGSDASTCSSFTTETESFHEPSSERCSMQ
jgi:hypothetical protein